MSVFSLNRFVFANSELPFSSLRRVPTCTHGETCSVEYVGLLVRARAEQLRKYGEQSGDFVSGAKRCYYFLYYMYAYIAGTAKCIYNRNQSRHGDRARLGWRRLCTLLAASAMHKWLLFCHTTQHHQDHTPTHPQQPIIATSAGLVATSCYCSPAIQRGSSF